jgi:hypothetical protein
MPANSKIKSMKPKDLRNYGHARARDLAFDAVQSLWRKRRAEGMKQSDLSNILDCEPAWISRNLRGPGNWTLRTFGALVQALRGDIEISVRAIEEPISLPRNYHAYAGYEIETNRRIVSPLPATPVTAIETQKTISAPHKSNLVVTALAS